MRHFIVTLLTLGVLSVPMSAQLGLGLSLTLDDASVEDGWYTITLRFYAHASSQEVLAQEELQGRFHGGYCHVTAGRSIELPESFLRSATAAVGFAIDGSIERLPRISVARQQFSETARNALNAQSLDPGFTGLVTSINEIAGHISMIGRDGVRVERDGSQLIIRYQASKRIRGIISGNNINHQFTISPGIELNDGQRVFAYVTNSTTHIDVSADINILEGTIILTAAAPLLASERLVWEIYE